MSESAAAAAAAADWPESLRHSNQGGWMFSSHTGPAGKSGALLRSDIWDLRRKRLCIASECGSFHSETNLSEVSLQVKKERALCFDESRCRVSSKFQLIIVSSKLSESEQEGHKWRVTEIDKKTHIWNNGGRLEEEEDWRYHGRMGN